MAMDLTFLKGLAAVNAPGAIEGDSRRSAPGSPGSLRSVHISPVSTGLPQEGMGSNYMSLF